MDVNGTSYHLLYNCEDWGGCLLETGDGTFTLADVWDSDHAAAEWDCDSASLRLAREVPLFRRHNSTPPLDVRARRGAGRDSYGNWYWIDSDETSILSQQDGSFTSTEIWPSAGQLNPVSAADLSSFSACMPQPGTHLLRGLAVTTKNYLVVGDVTAHGLQVFDLEGGGSPLLLLWPKDADFAPWDLAATPSGGVLVLDRDSDTYWSLDANFRLQAGIQSEDDMPFRPKNEGQGSGATRAGRPKGNAVMKRTTNYRGYALSGGSPPGPMFPIAIEPGPDCHVLILESDPAQVYSTIYEYDGAQLIASYELYSAVEVMDPVEGEGIPELFSVFGHDFAYVDDGGSDVFGSGCDCAQEEVVAQTGCIPPGAPLYIVQPRHVIYVADHQGKQAFAFLMDRQEMKLRDQRNFYPVRHWDGKAIVTADGQVYYDFANGGGNGQATDNTGMRWVPMMAFAECHYVGLAVLTTPANFDPTVPGATVVPGQQFDSNIPACVWHRLLLDAQIPQGTTISIRARASDDYTLLAQTDWSVQPDPYLRSGGAELPYYYPWKDVQPLPERTGTWELLFQNIEGRYLQLELTLSGTGRSTPAIRALRAWFPRFSYLEHYLPTLYQEDAVSASFLDRWLANFEGLSTNLEDKIEHAAELFDPRTAPAETLGWLACWLGLLLDPLWDETRRRLIIEHIDDFYRMRGTAFAIEVAVRIYTDADVDESVFNPACQGTSDVRIVEHFFTRGVGTSTFSSPASTGANRGVRFFVPLTPAVVASSAHSFTVLVPDGLTSEQTAMVERIVNLEKPSHTAYNLALYWEAFRVGDARLGLDTRLGEGYRYSPMLLGDTYLNNSYLEPTYPLNLADRIVLSRDSLGTMPAL